MGNGITARARGDSARGISVKQESCGEDGTDQEMEAFSGFFTFLKT